MSAYRDNLARLKLVALQRSMRLTADAARVEKVVGLMAANFEAVGEWICPCKQKHRPPVPGADITCPCPTLDAEVHATGTCHCRLFVAAS